VCNVSAVVAIHLTSLIIFRLHVFAIVLLLQCSECCLWILKLVFFNQYLTVYARASDKCIYFLTYLISSETDGGRD